MYLRHAEPIQSVTFEVELNQHGRFVAHHPTFMFRFHLNELRRFVLHHASVRESHIDLTVRHEPDVSVQAIAAAHQWAKIFGPMESWWIDQSLDSAGACPRYIHLDRADLAVLVCFHWS
jgi:hypothetical protein